MIAFSEGSTVVRPLHTVLVLFSPFRSSPAQDKYLSVNLLGAEGTAGGGALISSPSPLQSLYWIEKYLVLTGFTFDFNDRISSVMAAASTLERRQGSGWEGLIE